MTRDGNKFGAAIKANRERVEIPEETAQETPAPGDQPLSTVLKRGPGRPPAPGGSKKGSIEYTQATAYVRADVYANAIAALAKERARTGKRRQFSELVDMLLAEWLDSQQS